MRVSNSAHNIRRYSAMLNLWCPVYLAPFTCPIPVQPGVGQSPCMDAPNRYNRKHQYSMAHHCHKLPSILLHRILSGSFCGYLSNYSSLTLVKWSLASSQQSHQTGVVCYEFYNVFGENLYKNNGTTYSMKICLAAPLVCLQPNSINIHSLLLQLSLSLSLSLSLYPVPIVTLYTYFRKKYMSLISLSY